MRIIHCCLAAFYIDNYSYQENIIPKFHKNLGHNVFILASTETYNSNVELSYLEPSTYFTTDGILITRVGYVKWLPKVVARKLRIYKNVSHNLYTFKPEIIFIHDCQFLSILTISNYAKKNKVTIYIDSHTDFVNSGRGWISKYLLHKVIYKFCVKNIEKHTAKFYGTLPLRSDFLKDIYNIDFKKIVLLPFGADDSLFNWNEKQKIRASLRSRLNIPGDAFVFIAGGKIDRRKNIHLLLRAWCELKQGNKLLNSNLILFGKPSEDLKSEIEPLVVGKDIIYVDWLASQEIHKYFFASDLALFLGTHSVLWEEAVGLGLPCVFKKWKGIQHVDLGGNCMFLECINSVSIKDMLVKISENKNLFEEMKIKAELLGPKNFLYSEIAKRSLEY
jgi:glycosyltransferase involved in cell wall biosynthesis